jgi:hypothetical protein
VPGITKAAGRGLIAGVFLLGMASVAMSQTPALLQKSTEAPEIATRAQQDGFVRVIVRFASPVSPNVITPDPASVANVRVQVATAQDAIIAAHFDSATNPRAGQGFNRELVRFAITPGFAVSVSRAELDALAADPRVQYIHYNRMVPPTLNQSVPLIGMSNAYAIGATGAGQAVVVLDTGVKSSHEFLAGKVIAEACFSNNNVAGGNTLCPNGQGSQIGAGAASPDIANCTVSSTNICDHGTHVAGIAAGLNTNQQSGEPANGVAKNGNIWAIQIFTRSGSDVGAFFSDIICGLDHVFANMNSLPGGVKVASTNMSLGGGLFSSTCDSSVAKPSIDNLRNAGVLSAIAAGNDGSTSQVSEPGCISTAVTVGSTTKSDVISSFSNMSPVVDLIAPGSSIQSSVTVVPASNTTTYLLQRHLDGDPARGGRHRRHPFRLPECDGQCDRGCAQEHRPFDQ